MKPRHLLLLAAVTAGHPALEAWDYAGHRMVNQLALASLPADYPAFVHEPANAERIAFLAGEPDRWRNTSDLPLQHCNGMDHYLDLEQLSEAGLEPDEVSSLRYAFALQFAAGRAAHADNFAPIDPTRNLDQTREWPGFLPWAITECYGKLKSAFSCLQTFATEGGTPEEIANARATIVHLMGVMGHYVGDGAQPLHTTNHHHGWIGPNAHGYTTSSGIHAWIDGGFIAQAGITAEQIRPRVTGTTALKLLPQPDGRDPMFVAVMRYLQAQNAAVEPLYRLEKAGQFSGEHIDEAAAGRAFIEGQLLKGSEMLGIIWVTAWRNAGPDPYLAKQLARRREQTEAK
jgi:hypothetical protein